MFLNGIDMFIVHHKVWSDSISKEFLSQCIAASVCVCSNPFSLTHLSLRLQVEIWCTTGKGKYFLPFWIWMANFFNLKQIIETMVEGRVIIQYITSFCCILDHIFVQKNLCLHQVSVSTSLYYLRQFSL